MSEENIENKEGGDDKKSINIGGKEKSNDHVVFIGDKPFNRR
jgi:hypothetical protein|tara:strand:- start:20060 stop:20185 length:126 start_codon:yes stop_codon:yes gene_type:complete